jgi:signal transduction histidine kinase
MRRGRTSSPPRERAWSPRPTRPAAASSGDLHDGAQQRLVHGSITLGLAQRELEHDSAAAKALMAEAVGHVQQANEALRELAHGILPADLTRGGLRGAIDAVVERLDLAVKVELPARATRGRDRGERLLHHGRSA